MVRSRRRSTSGVLVNPGLRRFKLDAPVGIARVNVFYDVDAPRLSLLGAGGVEVTAARRALSAIL